MDIGLLIARLVFGLLFAAHGCQKLFGWFGGAGTSGTAAFLEGLGFRPGQLFAVANGLAECGGGVANPESWPRMTASVRISGHDRRPRRMR
jgi:putative oxidoreductase